MPEYHKILTEDEAREFLKQLKVFLDSKATVAGVKEDWRNQAARITNKALCDRATTSFDKSLLSDPRYLLGETLGNNRSGVNQIVKFTEVFTQPGTYEGDACRLSPVYLETSTAFTLSENADHPDRKQFVKDDGEQPKQKENPAAYVLVWRGHGLDWRSPPPKDDKPPSQTQLTEPVKKHKIIISRTLDVNEKHAAVAERLKKHPSFEVVSLKPNTDTLSEDYRSALGACVAVVGSGANFRDEAILAFGHHIPCFYLRCEGEESLTFPEHLCQPFPYHEDVASTVSDVVRELSQLSKSGDSNPDRPAHLLREISALVGEAKQHHTSAPYLGPFLSSALENTQAHFEKAIRRNLRVDIRHQHSFLILAAPLFEHAKGGIRAVSIDTVSTFWTDSETESQKYLDGHPPNTIRLFVFKSLESLVGKGLKLLKRHCKAYGDQPEGAVFVTSHKCYEDYLKRIGADLRTDKDFGVLSYLGGGFLHATLDKQYLEFTHHNSTDTLPSGCKRIRDDLDYLHMKVKGASTLSTGKGEVKLQAMRWGASLCEAYEKPDEIKRPDLSELFKGEERAVYHAVALIGQNAVNNRCHLRTVLEKLINNSSPEVSNKTDNLTLLEVFKKRYDIEDLAFLDRIPKNQFTKEDEVQRLEMAPSEFHPSVLWMKFSSQKALEKYYKDAQHEKFRREFYEACTGDQLKPLYAIIDSEATGTKQKENARRVIEQVMAHHIVRIDFSGTLTPPES